MSTWLPAIAALVSVLVSIVTLLSVGATIAIAWGRLTQGLRDHTADDARRFDEVGKTLTIIETDIKELLKRRR